MEIEEYKLRLSGVANLPQGLTNGKNYDLTITNCECRKIERIPNDNGTENEIAKLVISELSEINIIDGRQIIKAKKKGSLAQKLRFVIMEIARREGLDEEEYYTQEMSKIISTYGN